MVISSRTPEGRPSHCPVCGSDLRIEPSPIRPEMRHVPDAGICFWFTWDDLGDVHVITPMGSVLETESLDNLVDQLAIRPGMRLVIDFGAVHFLASPVLGHLDPAQETTRRGQGPPGSSASPSGPGGGLPDHPA